MMYTHYLRTVKGKGTCKQVTNLHIHKSIGVARSETTQKTCDYQEQEDVPWEDGLMHLTQHKLVLFRDLLN